MIGIAFVIHGFPKPSMGGGVGLSKDLAATGIPGGLSKEEFSSDCRNRRITHE